MRTGSSEVTVLNGNIDGFSVRNNVIHNNNNIGIDLIGFEGTAAKPTSMSTVNGPGVGTRHEFGYVRNGKVYSNIVYGSCTINNSAYWYNEPENDVPFGEEYDRCSGGILRYGNL